MAAALAPHLPAANFRAEAVEEMSFPAESVDVVLSVAVLHFARDTRHFDAMLQRMWQILKPGGLCFCRLASSIGMEGQIAPLDGRWFTLPDGSERFLVDEAMLLDRTRELGAELLDPLKTTIVQGKRAMTTWVVRKPA
jgi:tellurite methyltransferase